MIQQEIAKELVARFEMKIEQICNQSGREAHFDAAKECALIAADEMINYLKPIDDWSEPYRETENDISFCAYWQQVKQEIEKL